MYKLHLILKYLRKRRIAWVSLIAVMLCTAMVLVVISVMGGWLQMFRKSFHGLTGDVIVRSSLVGFPYYQEMIDEIEKLPGVKAATPTVETYGLVTINNQKRKAVQVSGIIPEKIGLVTNFPASLDRQYQIPRELARVASTQPGLKDDDRAALKAKAEAPPPVPSFELPKDVQYELLYPKIKDPRKRPGIILGSAIAEVRRRPDGSVRRPAGLFEMPASLTTVAIDLDTQSLNADAQSQRYYWVVDDSHTGVYQQDDGYVYVPFDVLQNDLRMDGDHGDPARCSTIQVGLKDWADMNAIRDQVQKIIDTVNARHQVDVGLYGVQAETWEDSQRTFLNAVEHEKLLMVILFGMISVVAIFLIFCIFYMIVAEKTKDIGIIKSVGATSGGVAGIFLGYGLAIGLVGAGCGFTLAFLIIRNINELHTWLGNKLGVVIWDPEVYAFDKIPDTMNPREVTIIVSVAIVSSVLGAVVPAIRAARMNPVEALRWE